LQLNFNIIFPNRLPSGLFILSSPSNSLLTFILCYIHATIPGHHITEFYAVGSMVEKKTECRVLVGKPEGGRILKKWMRRHGLDSSGTGEEHMAAAVNIQNQWRG
jgi:hypothetical protein